MAPRWLRAVSYRVALGVGWLGSEFSEDRTRWGLWSPVLFGLGIAVYFSLPVEPALWLGALILAALVAARFVVWERIIAGLVLTALGLMAAGFVAAQIRTAMVDAPIIEKRVRNVTVTGLLETVERRANGTRRLTLRVEKLEGYEGLAPYRVRVTMRRKSETLSPGMRLSLRATLMPPPAPAVPGGFDFARQAYYLRLGAVGYSTGPPLVLSQSSGGLSWARDAVSRRIRAMLPGEAGGVAAAVMTGDRSGISEEDRDAFQRTGLAHLLAISGLHMTAISALIFFLVRGGLALIERIALTQPVKKWAALVTIFAAGGYLLLSGMSVSTQRAFIMVAVAMLAVMTDRPVLSIRTVAVAAFAILALAPESLLNAGFQMSFAAVTALIAVYELMRERRFLSVPPGPVMKAGIWLSGILMTTLIASLAVAPISIFHFNRFGLFDLAANLFAVPLFTLIVMPSAVASFLLMPLGLDGVFLWVMGEGIDWILWGARGLSAQPYAAISVPALPSAFLGLCVLGGLWLALWKRPWRFLGASVLVPALLIAGFHQRADIFINRDGSRVAAVGEGGALRFSPGGRLDFEAEQWLRANGEAPGQGLNTRDWRCDAKGCAITLTDGRILAFAKTQAALAEDCLYADLLISAVPVTRDCAGPAHVIDRFDVWREGTHALTGTGRTTKKTTANAARGDRPWVLPKVRPTQ